MGAAAARAAATAMFFDLKADAASGMQSAIESVVGFGNTAANTFEGAYEAIKAIWGLLPAAIGDLAFQAANSLVDGVKAMLNGVVSRINGFIGGVNQGLEALGSERRISLVPDLDLGEIENRFEGAASAATTAAQAAFDRAFEDNPLTAPDLGLTEAANRALESANLYRGAARDLAEGARAPLESWQGPARCGARHRRGQCRCADRGHRRGRAVGDGARRCRSRRHRHGVRQPGLPPPRRSPTPRRPSPAGRQSRQVLSDYASRAREIGGRHRPEPRRRLPVGGERGGRVREDRKGELPRARHLAAGRSRPAGGEAVHPRTDRQCALWRVLRGGRHIRQRPACGRHGRLGRTLAHGPGHGLCRRASDARWRDGRASSRRGARDPAARRAGAVPAGGRRATARAAGSTSPSWPATPRASANQGHRWRRTSPAPCRSDGGACDGVSRGPVSRQHQPRRAGRAGAAHPRSSSSPRATRNATPAGPTRAAATTSPMASAARTISPPSSPSSRRGTVASMASASRTGATTSPACPRASFRRWISQSAPAIARPPPSSW